jgi:flagellar protein FlaJ
MSVGQRSAQAADLLGSIINAYEEMEMPARRYVLAVLLPTSLLFLITVVAAVAVETLLLVRLLLPLFGLLILGAGVAYPRVALDRRRIEMENRFHLMVTHLTVLSTTNIDRMEVFRKLGQEEEYGELAKEIRRVVQLVDTWNQSLDDACRRRAKAVPSDSLTDLFERLAYTLGAGQALDDFLLSEQSVMIENYSTIYESALDNLDVMKDLYLSMILSMTFALVFAVVLPILTGTDPTLTVAAVISMFAFVQLGFFLVIRAVTPHDPVWYVPEDVDTDTERKLLLAAAASGLLFVLLVAVMAGALVGVGIFRLLVPAWLPTPMYIAIPTLPFLGVALVFRIEEKHIRDRDEEFPSFIRALGATESAKQSTTSTVLSTLREKDFGSLTDPVDDLYRRLNMRIDTTRAWHLFTAENGSYLIQKFSEMYLVGREMGGDPKQLGELISRNMNEINQLREQRSQAATTLIGLLYGITAAASFAFFTGLQIVGILAGFEIGAASAGGMDFGKLLHTDVYNLVLLEALLLCIILFNAIVSSLTIRTADGGHPGNGFLHFVMLTWVGCATAVATEQLISMLLSV